MVKAYVSTTIWREEDARLEDAGWITPQTLALLPYCARAVPSGGLPSVMLAHIDDINTVS